MKASYDGYTFVEDSVGIYNHFSLLNTFDHMKFGDYWFEPGTPTYLVELLKSSHYDFQRFELGMSWTGYRGSQYFRGRIAEVRVWNRALSTGELQMNLCGVDSQSEGLVAYWKMLF